MTAGLTVAFADTSDLARPRETRAGVLQAVAAELQDSFATLPDRAPDRMEHHGALIALLALLLRTGDPARTVNPPRHAAKLPARFADMAPAVVRCNPDAPDLRIDTGAFDLAVLGLSAGPPRAQVLDLRVAALADCVALVIPNPALRRDRTPARCQLFWRAGRVGQSLLGGVAYADTGRGEWVLRLPLGTMVRKSPPPGQVEEFR